MPSISDAERRNPIPSHQNTVKSPRLRWGTGHRWCRSWGRWDWATTSAGRWGFPSSATPLHTFLSAVPHPSGASLCRSELGLAPMGQTRTYTVNVKIYQEGSATCSELLVSFVKILPNTFSRNLEKLRPWSQKIQTSLNLNPSPHEFQDEKNIDNKVC